MELKPGYKRTEVGVIPEDWENAGTVFYRHGRFNCTNVCGTIKLRKHNSLFVSKILGILAKRYVSKNLANPKLMNDVAKQILVPLPPTLHEQTAIAAALSDVDALITSLDQLIAKKRDIRQATMQQLLTGKRRLPGFSGEWGVKKLGEVGKPYGGMSGKSKGDFAAGQYPYIPFLNIMNNPVIDINYFDYVNIDPGER